VLLTDGAKFICGAGKDLVGQIYKACENVNLLKFLSEIEGEYPNLPCPTARCLA
jgi:hypothetical protein